MKYVKEKTVITTQDWIKQLMTDEIIKICPRCCENLTHKRLFEYLEVWGLEEGAVREKIGEFESLGINKGYHLYADCMDHDGKYNYEEGTEFYLCSACAEGGVDWHEKSEEWPIEGRG